MAKIVLATFGSLGDMHPKIALGLELKTRGHDVSIAAMEFYREKIGQVGLGFSPMRPHLDPNDTLLAAELMDAVKGPEKIIKEIIFGNIRAMHDDLMAAVADADLVVTGEIVYPIKSVVELTGIKWVSTSLQPGTLFSPYDPFVPPAAPWIEHLRFMPPWFFRSFFRVMHWTVKDWYRPYREFRRDLGLGEDHDPIFADKYSELLHLVLFSRVLGEPQPDWPSKAKQTGFCFYDGQADSGQMPDELEAFLDAGEPPLVFTLGSAAVMDPRDFFEQSIDAAKKLNKRAVVIHGVFGEPPQGLTETVVGVDYAPFSKVFPRSACVVHQGGVGTTGQVLRAGVPHLIMPYSHDQPDNAARCRRAGVAEVIHRDSYHADSAAAMLEKLLRDPSYAANAKNLAAIVAAEPGTAAACDAIEDVLNGGPRRVE